MFGNQRENFAISRKKISRKKEYALEIKRDVYLNKLISKKHNGLIKVVTGIRRCGKSYLLFSILAHQSNITLLI